MSTNMQTLFISLVSLVSIVLGLLWAASAIWGLVLWAQKGYFLRLLNIVKYVGGISWLIWAVFLVCGFPETELFLIVLPLLFLSIILACGPLILAVGYHMTPEGW